MVGFFLRRWPWFAFLASAAMLGAAHAFESFGGLQPCTLCLKQREAYWIAGSVALVGIALGFTPWRGPLARWICGALVLAFLYSLGWAGYHAGVEQHWWPGPAACSGGAGTVTAADLQRLLNSPHIELPKCDAIVWSFLGLSMAGWNAVVSLVLVAVSAMAALSKPAP